jgi:polyhydroxybutyrate depolymerase
VFQSNHAVDASTSSSSSSFLLGQNRNRNDIMERSIVHDGLTRWFLEYRPTSFSNSSSTHVEEDRALVIVLHGGTQSMRAVVNNKSKGTNRWISLSEENGFLLLAPNGVNLETGDTYGDDQNWSDLRFLGTNGTSVVDPVYDDIGFIGQLVQWSITEEGVNPAKVYVTGGSNGGLMTYTLLIRTPELYAAGAAFIANLPEEFVPTTPHQSTPIMIMNGNQDRLMPWNGGPIADGTRGVVRSALETRDYWIQVNRADATRVVSTRVPNRNWFDRCRIQSDLYPSITGNNASAMAPVHFYTMDGGGHSIPSRCGAFNPVMIVYNLFIGGPACHDANGADLAWEFFSSYTYYS